MKFHTKSLVYLLAIFAVFAVLSSPFGWVGMGIAAMLTAVISVLAGIIGLFSRAPWAPTWLLMGALLFLIGFGICSAPGTIN